MKREDIPYLVKHPYPNDYMEFKMLLGSALRAIYSNPTLQVVNKPLFDELMEFKKDSSDFAAFFYKNGIEDEPFYVCKKVIAKDKDGDLLILNKCDEGQFIEVEVPLSFWEDDIRFGISYPVLDKRYYFYMTSNIYIDYHDPFFTKGTMRKVKTVTAGGWDTKFYDEDGNSNIITYLEGTWKDLKNIFR